MELYIKNKKSAKSTSFILLILFVMSSLNTLQAQSKRVSFSGAARSVMYYDNLGGDIMNGDTTSADKSFNGYALLDLGVNVNPNKTTHIETVLRLRSTLGGFWGAGVNLEVRKLLVEGIIAKKLKYKFGDFNFNLTPYTFNYNQEELSINEPGIFQDYKEILYYDNLISDTAWRQQGLMLDFGLEAEKAFKSMDFKAFITRTRSANIAAFPDRFFSGFHWKMNQSKYFSMGVTLVDLFDLAATSKTDYKLNNLVTTLNFDVKYPMEKMTVGLKGEAGLSRSDYTNADKTVKNLSDYFYDATLYAKTDLGINAAVSFNQVGVNFTSAGSQSKRMNWDAQPTIFNEVTNDVVSRNASLIDIYYDETLYNQQIQQQLQTYLPKYSNALPYGPATPNRRGLNVKVDYTEAKKEFIETGISYSYLTEIVGSGSFNLKQFTILNGYANFHLDKLIKYDKKLLVTLGGQLERTTRDGLEFSAIQLNSNLIEAGFEIEIFKKFDLLAGVKWFMADGNEFLEIRNNYNELVDFRQYNVDERNVLYAGGLKYRFNEDIFVTAQYIHNDINIFAASTNSYTFNRAMLLFNMKF